MLSWLAALGFRWRYWLCEAIDLVRPGAGHQLSDMSSPPKCVWCGEGKRRDGRQ